MLTLIIQLALTFYFMIYRMYAFRGQPSHTKIVLKGSLRDDINELKREVKQLNKKVNKLQRYRRLHNKNFLKLKTEHSYHKYIYALQALISCKQLVNNKSLSEETRHALKKLDHLSYTSPPLMPYICDQDSYLVIDYKLHMFKDKWLNMPEKVYDLFLMYYTEDFMNDITNYFLLSYTSLTNNPLITSTDT